jgi:hypothetical protein
VSARSRLLALSLTALSAAACVSAPTPAEVLASGFRTPEQAFRAFQVAVAADDPGFELLCFSSAFRARHRISQLTWREAREDLYARQPWLRLGISRAEVEGIEIEGARARLAVRAGSRRIEVRLVREEFGQLWRGAERAFDDQIGWDAATGAQADGGRRWFFGQVELPEGVPPEEISELRVGREWKIDDVVPLDE